MFGKEDIIQSQKGLQIFAWAYMSLGSFPHRVYDVLCVPRIIYLFIS